MKIIPLIVLLAACHLAGRTHAAIIFVQGPIFDWEDSVGAHFNYHEYLDLDGDGADDFYVGSASNGAFLVPLGNNRILSTPAGPPEMGGHTVAMTGGELIGATTPSGIWLGRLNFNQSDPGCLIYACYGRGAVGQPPIVISTIPSGVLEAFLGVEFSSEGSLHYGWIAISNLFIGSDHRPLLNGWAYESQAGQGLAAAQIPEPSSAILAGAGALGILGRRRRQSTLLR